MPKFKIGDYIMFRSDSPRSDYYKIVAFRQNSYVVNIYSTSANEIRRTNCTGAIDAVDTDFILYHPVLPTQIRRP